MAAGRPCVRNRVKPGPVRAGKIPADGNGIMRALRTCFPHTRAAVRKSSLGGSGFFRGGTRQSSLSRFSHVSTATPTSASAHEHVSRLAHRETRKTFAARYVHAVFEDTTVNRRRLAQEALTAAAVAAVVVVSAVVVVATMPLAVRWVVVVFAGDGDADQRERIRAKRKCIGGPSGFRVGPRLATSHLGDTLSRSAIRRSVFTPPRNTLSTSSSKDT